MALRRPSNPAQGRVAATPPGSWCGMTNSRMFRRGCGDDRGAHGGQGGDDRAAARPPVSTPYCATPLPSKERGLMRCKVAHQPTLTLLRRQPRPASSPARRPSCVTSGAHVTDVPFDRFADNHQRHYRTSLPGFVSRICHGRAVRPRRQPRRVSSPAGRPSCLTSAA